MSGNVRRGGGGSSESPAQILSNFLNSVVVYFDEAFEMAWKTDSSVTRNNSSTSLIKNDRPEQTCKQRPLVSGNLFFLPARIFRGLFKRTRLIDYFFLIWFKLLSFYSKSYDYYDSVV